MNNVATMDVRSSEHAVAFWSMTILAPLDRGFSLLHYTDHLHYD
jgi:hypothetical protein